MNTISKTLLGLALMSAAPVTAQEKPPLPAWMAGAWIDAKADSWTEEFWTPPRGGLMIGAGRNGKGNDLLGWEATRIAVDKDGKVAFIAMPEGGTPVTFALEKSDASTISFTNPAHDYPQRVRYWRDGVALLAEISLIDGSKAMRWRYHPIDQK